MPDEERGGQTRSPSMSMFFSTHMSSSLASSSVMRTRLFFFFVARSPSLSLLRLLFIVRANQIAYLSSALRQSISTCLNFTQSFDLEIFGDSLVLDIFTDIHEDGHHCALACRLPMSTRYHTLVAS